MAIYAVSDLHGMMGLYKSIKEFLRPADKVVCLGDCGDRGYDSWELVKVILLDPQFIYLKGNHEDMLVKAMKEYFSYEEQFSPYAPNTSLLIGNGGFDTIQGWLAEERFHRDWMRKIDALPQEYVYEGAQATMILTHAGFDPDETERDYLWDREHVFYPWTQNPDYEKVILVHGHTPIPSLMRSLGESPTRWEVGAYWYCQNHKVDIDCGAFSTNTCILLDLDTFDEYIFQDNNHY